MPSFVGWDEQGEKKKGQGGGQFLKLEAGKTYRVRLVSNAVRYFQHWEPVICRSPGVDAKGTVLDPLMQMNFAPKERYAIWVFDREDGNKLKVMDFPPTLYEQFSEWKVNFNDAPGGPSGPDWKIKLEVRGNDRRKTQYKAAALDKTPLTSEELELIKNGNLKEKLAELRKENTPEEIRNLLAAKNGDPTGPSTARPNAPIPTATAEMTHAAPAAPAAPSTPAAAPKGFDF